MLPPPRVPGLAEKTVRPAAGPIEANHADPAEGGNVLSFLVSPEGPLLF